MLSKNFKFISILYFCFLGIVFSAKTQTLTDGELYKACELLQLETECLTILLNHQGWSTNTVYLMIPVGITSNPESEKVYISKNGIELHLLFKSSVFSSSPAFFEFKDIKRSNDYISFSLLLNDLDNGKREKKVRITMNTKDGFNIDLIEYF